MPPLGSHDTLYLHLTQHLLSCSDNVCFYILAMVLVSGNLCFKICPIVICWTFFVLDSQILYLSHLTLVSCLPNHSPLPSGEILLLWAWFVLCCFFFSLTTQDLLLIYIFPDFFLSYIQMKLVCCCMLTILEINSLNCTM